MLTRQNKEEQDIHVLKQEWQERAHTLGFDAHEFLKNRNQQLETNSFFSALKEKVHNLINHFKKQNTSELDAARACVHVAVERLSQRTAFFSERQLLTESMKHSLIAPQSITQKELLAAIEQENKAQTLYEAKCPETQQTVYTTPWLLTLEAETIARIEHNKGVVPAIASRQHIKSFQQKRASYLIYPMTQSQKQSMIALLTSQDRFSAIQGFAGVAKTSMLAEAKTLIEEKGYMLRGITVASSAAHELQTKAGIRTDVFPIVHQELKEAPTGSLFKTLFIVDEASMLSSHQGHELLKQIERTGARLILVGDKAQLPSVNTGRIFSLAQDYGIETSVMDEIVRQQNQKAKEAVICATKGDVQGAIERLNVQILPTYEKRIQWIAEHWLSLSPKQRDETLLFAPTHANRKAITQILRGGLKQESSLNGDALIQKVLHPKSIEAVQQRFVSYYQKGDVVRFNQNFNKGIKQGAYFTVGQMTKKHYRDNVLLLINTEGKSFNFPLKNLPAYKTHSGPFERIIELYQAKELELLKGDKVMWTRNFKELDLRNGQCAKVHEIKEHDIVFKNQEGAIFSIQKAHPALNHLDYSYVLTNYKVQGKDAPYGIGLMESYHRFSATMKNFYVQISRAIHGMTLVTDNKEQLVQAIQKNSDEKRASLDVISSHKLNQHVSRFTHNHQFSIKPAIDKKIQFELQNERINSLRQLNKIEELSFTKDESGKVFIEKTKNFIKELEL